MAERTIERVNEWKKETNETESLGHNPCGLELLQPKGRPQHRRLITMTSTQLLLGFSSALICQGIPVSTCNCENMKSEELTGHSRNNGRNKTFKIAETRMSGTFRRP